MYHKSSKQKKETTQQKSTKSQLKRQILTFITTAQTAHVIKRGPHHTGRANIHERCGANDFKLGQRVASARNGQPINQLSAFRLYEHWAKKISTFALKCVQHCGRSSCASRHFWFQKVGLRCPKSLVENYGPFHSISAASLVIAWNLCFIVGAANQNQTSKKTPLSNCVLSEISIIFTWLDDTSLGLTE